MSKEGKLCIRCGEVKPREQFYRNVAMTDGLAGSCKACADFAKKWTRRRDRVRVEGMRATPVPKMRDPKPFVGSLVTALVSVFEQIDKFKGVRR